MAGLKVMTVLSEIMMNIWKNGNYIRNNPVKTGLCQAPEEYPFLWEPGEPLE